MSRRKQSKPRHLDEEEDPRDILLNGPVNMPLSRPDDAHVCGKCGTDFLDLSEFLTHKKNCTVKRIVTPGDEDSNSKIDDLDSESKHDNMADIAMETDSVTDNVFEERDKEDVSLNSNLNIDKITDSKSESECSESVAKETDMNEPIENEVKGEVSVDDPISREIQAEIDEDVDDADLDEEIDEEDEELNSSQNLFNPLLPQYPGWQANAAQLLGNSNNVVLEPIEGTKAAVSQIADTTSPPSPSSDLVMLHATLSSLQQQQLIQLTLIQQLQHQILTGLSSQGMPSTALNPLACLSAMTSISPSLPSLSQGYPPLSSSYPLLPTSSISALPTSTAPSITATANEASSSKISASSSTSVSPSLNGQSATSSTHLEEKRSDPISQLTSISSPGSTSVVSSVKKGKPPNVTVTATALDRTQYASEDPFFKHKCRFCHKVFGSDSALQIHVRSHTGERPFKCHICGNRFSTRGNLKVHFTRHKARYPDAKMNPHPVPEHLDPDCKPKVTSTLLPPSLPPVPMATNMNSARLLPSTTLLPMSVTVPPTTSATLPAESSSSPVVTATPAQTSPNDTASIAPPRRSPDVTDTANTETTLPSAPSSAPLQASTHVTATMTTPLTSPLAATLPPFPLPGMGLPQGFNPAIVPLDKDPVESMEEFMEITKSETSKLQQLVDSLDRKVTDPNECVICNRVLSCKSALQMHYRIHTGERPFKCKICGRSFTTKGNLKTHMGVHRVKSPMRLMHQCPVCHKQFTNLLVLQQHIRMHTSHVQNQPLHMPSYRREDSLPYPHPPLVENTPAEGLDLRKESVKSPDSQKVKEEKEIEKYSDLETNQDGTTKANSEKSDRGSPSSSIQDCDDSVEDKSSHKPSSLASISPPVSSGLPFAQYPPTSEVRYSLTPYEEMHKAFTAMSSQFLNSQSMLSPFSGMHAPIGYPFSASSIMPPMMPGAYPSSYSMSLAALEERVKAIDAHNAREKTEKKLEGEEDQNDKDEIRRHIANALEREENYTSKYHTEKGDIGTGDSVRQLERMTEEMEKPKAMNGLNGSYGNEDISDVSDDGSDVGSEDRSRSRHTTGQDVDDAQPSSSPISRSVSPFTGSNLSMDSTSQQSMTAQSGKASPDSVRTTCSICHKTFGCVSALDIHYRSHMLDKPYKCDVCDKSFSTKCNLKQHVLTHKIREIPEKVDGLKRDYRDENGNEKVDDVFSSPKTPNGISLKRDHPASPSSEREEKRQKLSSSSSIDTTPNLVRHRTLNKHQCSVCLKQFSSASALQIHFRTHTGDRPFKCNVCGKAFTTKGNLKVHMGTHMWNTSPSRRGRRMSVENPPSNLMSSKDGEYLSSVTHRSPSDLYFQYPPMSNGISSKMNEVPVMPAFSGLPHMPNPALLMNGYFQSSAAEALMKASGYYPPSSVSDNHEKTSPISSSSQKSDQRSKSPENDKRSSSSPSYERHAESPRNTAWLWKTTCHICNKSCASVGALELHLQSHYSARSESPKQVAV